MDRRRFLSTTVAGVLAAPHAAEAQQVGKRPRIGVLTDYFAEAPGPAEELRQGLRDLGWVEGQNIIIEWRWARGESKRHQDFAAELVRLNVDAIVAPNNDGIMASQRATKTIPIVMVIATDPVGLGFVASLARPG